ncbi:MAG: hypothetical protein ACQGVC_12810 [Myxococcota bacterium]
MSGSRGAWRWIAWLLRAFAFAWIGVLGAVLFYAPALRQALGAASWWSTLLPVDPAGIVVWIGVATLNAGAAFFLAAHLESGNGSPET